MTTESLHPRRRPGLAAPADRRRVCSARAHRRRRRLRPLPARALPLAGLLLPRLAGRLGLLAGRLPRLPGDLHAAPPDRRRLGLVVSRRVLEAASRTLPVIAASSSCPLALRACAALRVGAPGGGRGDEVLQHKAARTSTRRSSSAAAGPLLRDLVRLRLARSTACRCARTAARTRRCTRRMQVISAGPGLARLLPGRHLRLGRLADVAAAALVLDHLRRLPDGQPGARGARLPDRRRPAACRAASRWRG